MRSLRRCAPSFVALACCFFASRHVQGQSPSTAKPLARRLAWPDYRGPTLDGHAHEDVTLPEDFGETKNVRWKTAIHGRAWSTPAVADGEVWLTTASKDGKKLSAVVVDFETGELVFDKVIFEVDKPQFAHAFNSYASPSPVLDEAHVCLSFGSPGNACFERKTRKLVWSRRDLRCDHFRGAGSSPLLYRDLLILTMDGADVKYVIALDKRTGKTRWKTERSTAFGDLDEATGKPKGDGDWRKGFSTPLLIEVAGKEQLVSPGAKAAFAYDPSTGEEIWTVRRGNHSSASRTVYGHGLVFLNTGFARPDLLAIDPRGKGDVTETHVRWKLSRGVPKKPSPLLIGEHLYLVNDAGIASCVAAKSGKVAWRHRFDASFSASTIYADGRVLAASQDGDVVMFEATPKRFVSAGSARFKSGFMASPVAVGKSLLLRSKTHLYRITGKP